MLQSSSACRVGSARPPRPCDARALLGKRVAGFDLAALEAGELLALTRHLRPRLVPSEEPPAPAVAERIVQMSTEELRELGPRLREWLAPAAAEG